MFDQMEVKIDFPEKLAFLIHILVMFVATIGSDWIRFKGDYKICLHYPQYYRFKECYL